MHVKMLRSAVVPRLQCELKEAKNKRIFGKKLSSDTYRRLIKKALMTTNLCSAGLHNTLITGIRMILTRP